MTTLSDQLERDRFTSGDGKNISVIAPAGVGKTYAIVQRIVSLARQPEDVTVDRLSRLVVVTYSVRAAQQMQQRARVAMRVASVSPKILRAFQQVFFGTIHSYCVRLLERYGHFLGLPSPAGLLLDHDEWWNRFLTRGLAHNPASENLGELFHFYAPEKLYALGREISPGAENEIARAPAVDLRALLGYPVNGLHSSTKRSLANAQAAVQRWGEAWARGDRYFPLPKCPDTKQVTFVELWATTFAPLHDWLRVAALEFGRRIANSYERFRLEQAVMTYEDQVRLALRLLQHPAVQAELAQERPSILLDEAQDTDPDQFKVLQRAAGLSPGVVQPSDQSFCIVGDFQQAIYTPRSDLSVYRQVHDDLTVEPRGAASTLKVTFRCDEAIIQFVNRIFPSVLHGESGQSEFFALQARESAGPGQVARWLCPDDPGHAAGAKLKADDRARHEAQFLAKQIHEKGLSGLHAESWDQVAILCPRRNWLWPIARELKLLGIEVQFHSSDETQSDRTPAVWLTALIWIAAHPEDSFEIAGVLREVFGVPDHDMAVFTGGDGDRLRLDRPAIDAPGAVADALRILREAFDQAAARPLHLAVRTIVEHTHLRERLESIAEHEMEIADGDLDELLALTMEEAAGDATLAELAQILRQRLAQSSKVEEETRDAIQLMTSHKAKGLEWQTVIVPFMFRAIESKSPSYPRLVQLQGKETIFRDKGDYKTEDKIFLNERDRQQLQRLLYVTCTRAKHNLLFVDDKTLFDGQMHRGGWSSGDLLGFLGGVNRISWEALPGDLKAKKAAKVARAKANVDDVFHAALTSAEVEKAKKSSRDIPRRITPHALAIHAPPEAEPEMAVEREEAQTVSRSNPGILYGTWWHEFIQTIDWNGPRDAWERRFELALRSSSQPERSRREWKIFCESELADWLSTPGRIIHSEIPFLYRESEAQCLEGVIDLAVFTPGEKSWRVIDWKTNYFEAGSGRELVEIYRGQILAYARAMRETLSAEVSGFLYLTATGDLMAVE